MASEIINVLQIDVEDWYCDLDFDQWASCEDRIVHSTKRVIDILKETGNKATFFVLAYVAELHPEIVQMILEEGHEVGTHGYRHVNLNRRTESDYNRSRHVAQ